MTQYQSAPQKPQKKSWDSSRTKKRKSRKKKQSQQQKPQQKSHHTQPKSQSNPPPSVGESKPFTKLIFSPPVQQKDTNSVQYLSPLLNYLLHEHPPQTHHLLLKQLDQNCDSISSPKPSTSQLFELNQELKSLFFVWREFEHFTTTSNGTSTASGVTLLQSLGKQLSPQHFQELSTVISESLYERLLDSNHTADLADDTVTSHFEPYHSFMAVLSSTHPHQSRYRSAEHPVQLLNLFGSVEMAHYFHNYIPIRNEIFESILKPHYLQKPHATGEGINLSNIDLYHDELIQLLKIEIEWLDRDINWLRECIESEGSARRSSTAQDEDRRSALKSIENLLLRHFSKRHTSQENRKKATSSLDHSSIPQQEHEEMSCLNSVIAKWKQESSTKSLPQTQQKEDPPAMQKQNPNQTTKKKRKKKKKNSGAQKQNHSPPPAVQEKPKESNEVKETTSVPHSQLQLSKMDDTIEMVDKDMPSSPPEDDYSLELEQAQAVSEQEEVLSDLPEDAVDSINLRDEGFECPTSPDSTQLENPYDIVEMEETTGNSEEDCNPEPSVNNSAQPCDGGGGEEGDPVDQPVQQSENGSTSQTTEQSTMEVDSEHTEHLTEQPPIYSTASPPASIYGFCVGFNSPEGCSQESCPYKHASIPADLHQEWTNQQYFTEDPSQQDTTLQQANLPPHHQQPHPYCAPQEEPMVAQPPQAAFNVMPQQYLASFPHQQMPPHPYGVPGDAHAGIHSAPVPPSFPQTPETAFLHSIIMQQHQWIESLQYGHDVMRQEISTLRRQVEQYENKLDPEAQKKRADSVSQAEPDEHTYVSEL